jgi:hypothetical protein
MVGLSLSNINAYSCPIISVLFESHVWHAVWRWCLVDCIAVYSTVILHETGRTLMLLTMHNSCSATHQWECVLLPYHKCIVWFTCLTCCLAVMPCCIAVSPTVILPATGRTLMLLTMHNGFSATHQYQCVHLAYHKCIVCITCLTCCLAALSRCIAVSPTVILPEIGSILILHTMHNSSTPTHQ